MAFEMRAVQKIEILVTCKICRCFSVVCQILGCAHFLVYITFVTNTILHCNNGNQIGKETKQMVCNSSFYNIYTPLVVIVLNYE